MFVCHFSNPSLGLYVETLFPSVAIPGVGVPPREVVVQLLRMAACQASLSFTISWSLLKLMSIESMMPSNHLIFCHPLLHLSSIFPSIRVFSNEQFFTSGGQSIRTLASTEVIKFK